jgi:hypothetical protein
LVNNQSNEFRYFRRRESMEDMTIGKRRTVKLAAIMLFFFGVSIGIVYSNAGGPPTGRAGVPEGGGFLREPTCDDSGCHESFSLNPDTRGKIAITGLPDNYLPGKTYHLTFSITHPDPDRIRWGFEATAVARDTYLGAGNFVVTDRRNTQLTPGSGLGPAKRQYIGHNILGTGFPPGTRGGKSWTFDWVAPSTNIGDVAFFGSGNAANGSGEPLGDKIYNPTPNPVALTKGQFTFTNVAADARVAADPSGGVAVGDFNKDGQPDIFIARDGQDLLYRNNGDGTFAEVAMQAGIVTADAPGRAAAWGDYDGDGNPDLYVVNAGSDALYHNNGDGTFTDVSAMAGISDQAVGHAVAWGDFNGDQHLDLYVANEEQDILYWNNGDGTFTKADLMMAGIAEQAAGWSVALADFNGDGKLDIFVANDGQDFLYKNNGDGTFTDVAAAAGIQTANAQGRAAAWADYNRDGRVDLFIANVGANLLYKNNGDGTFMDVTMAAGLADTGVGAAVAWGDYDKDGDLDLFVANEGQDFLYRNNGNGTFNEVATFSGLTDTAVGRGAAWLDADGDDNLDLYVTNADGGNFLYRNPGRSGSASATQPTGGYLSSLIAWFKTRLFS